MIPAGRTAIDFETIAAKFYKISYDALRKRGTFTAPGAPPVISSAAAGRRLYDRAQVAAFAAGRAFEPLPAEPHPDDLLDRGDAPASLARPVKPGTWDTYVDDGTAPPPDKVIHGVPHWYRRTVAAFDTNRPGSGTGGGRPAGATDTRPRRPRGARVDEVRALLAGPDPVTAQDVATRFRVSRTVATALIEKARTPAGPQETAAAEQ